MGLTNNLGKLSNMITSTGSAVGIAQSSPSYTLDVTGTGRYTSQLYIGNYDGIALKMQTATSTGASYLRFYNSAGSGEGYFGLFNNSGTNYMLLDAVGRELAFTSSSKFTFTGGGNVGIGTSSPSTLLHLNSSSGEKLRLETSVSTPAFMTFYVSGTRIGYFGKGSAGSNDLYVAVDAAANTIFENNATERMRITSGGNVGIGTTSPATKLEVNGTIQSYASTGNIRSYSTNAANDAIMFAGWTSDTGIEMRYNPNSAISYIQNTYPATSGQPFGDIHFRQSVSGTMTTRMIIKADGGYVGIGTSSPVNLLGIQSASANSRVINIYNGLTGAGDYVSIGSQYAYNNAGVSSEIRFGNEAFQGAPAYLAFATGGTERLRIKSNGTIYNLNPPAVDWAQVIYGSSSANQSYGLKIQAGSSASDLSLYVMKYDTSLTFYVRGDGYVFAPSTYYFTTGGAANMYVASDGSFNRSTSSLKYKKDVRNYDKGLSEVMQMRPVYYKGKSEADGDKQYAGLIAEEIHDLGLTEFVQYADDETPDALAYSNMVALLVKAIQEQQAQIEELKLKIK